MPATLQRYADRQNIHAIGGVVSDLGDGLVDDGRKVGLVRIEAQLSAAPDIGHMMQAVLAAVGSGQHYAVDLVGAGGETDPGNVAGAALQRWHGVFCGGLQRDDGAGRSTGVMVGGRKRNLFQNLRKRLNILTETTAGRIILAEGPLRSGFL